MDRSGRISLIPWVDGDARAETTIRVSSGELFPKIVRKQP